MPSPTEVIIIGGGPAGSSAAIRLAMAGHRVTLFERHRHPRHKMCGEFLSPEAVPLLRELGAWEAIEALAPPELAHVRVVAPDGRRLDTALPAPAIGLSRYALDHLLLARARAVGVEVHEGAAASGVEGSLDGGFRVMAGGEEYRARVLLGAWGKRSTMDRVLARPFFGGPAGFLALKRHARGPEPEDRTELYGFAGGYCGVNRIEGGAVNLCLLASDAAWARHGRAVGSFWAGIQRENPALGARLAGAAPITEEIVISNISFAPRAPVERDVLMLGDSAALISPLTGNGQSMALQGAALAAPLVGAFLRGEIGAAALRSGYARRWQRTFRERLWLGRGLQPLLLRPAILGPALRVVGALPPLARWLVAGTRERGTERQKAKG